MNNRKDKSSSAKPSESGFTLLESLIAIVILTILLTGVAPMIFLSTATRIQARRVERATQSARAYIDGVRTGAIPPPNAVVLLDEVNRSNPQRPTFNPLRLNNFSTVPAPTAPATFAACVAPATAPTSPTADQYPYCKNPLNPTAAPGAESLYCVDVNGNGCSTDNPHDLIIQAYRSVTALPNTEAERQAQISRGYLLSVRVYRADALKDPGLLSRSGNLESGDPNRPRATQRSSGASFNRKAPVLEMTTEVTRMANTNNNAPRGTTFQDFCDRFGGCTQ